jgi:hypothetical protein
MNWKSCQWHPTRLGEELDAKVHQCSKWQNAAVHWQLQFPALGARLELFGRCTTACGGHEVPTPSGSHLQVQLGSIDAQHQDVIAASLAEDRRKAKLSPRACHQCTPVIAEVIEVVPLGFAPFTHGNLPTCFRPSEMPRFTVKNQVDAELASRVTLA